MVIIKEIKWLVCIVFLVGCTDTKRGVEIPVSKIDFSKVNLIIDRGAFHYDKFVLSDTTVIYYPSEESLDNKYGRVSKASISEKQRNQFIQQIIDEGIFDLKDSYSSQTSCNSSLTVTLQVNNVSKTIICEDFERGCLDILKLIEKEIVELHNKELTRIYLPG